MAGDERGFSSAVSSVLFHRGHENFKETRAGTYIYAGEPATFHEWEFRTKLRSFGKRGDQYVTETSKIVDGLRGDAFVVAQDVGLKTGHYLRRLILTFIFPMDIVLTCSSI